MNLQRILRIFKRKIVKLQKVDFFRQIVIFVLNLQRSLRIFTKKIVKLQKVDFSVKSQFLFDFTKKPKNLPSYRTFFLEFKMYLKHFHEENGEIVKFLKARIFREITIFLMN